MLHINDLTFRIGGRLLFDRATVAIPARHKVGLVGRNGAGKTTLFRLILGELHPDSGSIRLAGRARVGTVAQEAPDGDASLLETVLAADAERARLLAEAASATEPSRIAEIHTRLADIGAHAAPARAAAILAGLGFEAGAEARPCRDFSGGWRMRVALAAALFARPDLLLLDEPTNHLDLEASLWLESHLAAWGGTLIVISHDRALLNRAVDGIIHLEDGRLTRYVGGYDRFERTRRERLTQQARLAARSDEERRRIQAFVDRFRAKATKARQAQSRLKMLARMAPIAAVVEERAARFDFPAPEQLPPPLVSVDGASVGYGGPRPVLSRVSLRIDQDDRIALVGANGNGKSTLVKLMAGRLEPAAGRVVRPSRLRVGYFAQHQADELDAADTPFLHLSRLMPEAAPSAVRAQLGRFDFAQERADTPIAALSGGEKARLLFCLMSRSAPHLMLLDEPTNHLDVDAREALVQALNAYEGAVVLVSHDAHLVELVADRLWLVADGGCRPFDGDVEDYRRLVVTSARAERREGRPGRGEAVRANRRDERRERAVHRADTAALRRAAAAAELTLEVLGRDKAEIERRLADPALYAGPSERIAELGTRLAEINRRLAEEEASWLAAHEALEAAG